MDVVSINTIVEVFMEHTWGAVHRSRKHIQRLHILGSNHIQVIDTKNVLLVGDRWGRLDTLARKRELR